MSDVGFHFTAQHIIASAGLVEKGCAFIGSAIECRLGQVIYLLPSLGSHRSLLLIIFSSQPLALRRSRITVTRDTAITSAVSSTSAGRGFERDLPGCAASPAPQPRSSEHDSPISCSCDQ
jgi:hypothetical protein